MSFQARVVNQTRRLVVNPSPTTTIADRAAVAVTPSQGVPGWAAPSPR